MKSNIRWTIVFIFMMVMAWFLIDSKDIRQLAIVISFWLSIACQYLEDIKTELVKQNFVEEEEEDEEE